MKFAESVILTGTLVVGVLSSIDEVVDVKDEYGLSSTSQMAT